MRPTIQPGEPLTISPATDLRIGDVVALIGLDGSLHAHRLVRREAGRLWTRGDATRWTDPPVVREQLIGLVARGGIAGAAIARWPTLAPLLGVLIRVRRPGDVPGAARALTVALVIRLLRR